MNLEKNRGGGKEKCTHWFEQVLLVAVMALHEFHGKYTAIDQIQYIELMEHIF